jgi:hypothetical protein
MDQRRKRAKEGLTRAGVGPPSDEAALVRRARAERAEVEQVPRRRAARDLQRKQVIVVLQAQPQRRQTQREAERNEPKHCPRPREHGLDTLQHRPLRQRA